MRVSPHLFRGNCNAHAGCNGRSHVPDGKPSKLGELLHIFNDHGFCGFDFDNCCIPGLDEGRILLFGLAGPGIELLYELCEGAGGLCGMAVEYRGVSHGDGAGVLKHHDLGSEFVCNSRWGIGRAADISTAQVALGDTTNVKANIIAG